MTATSTQNANILRFEPSTIERNVRISKWSLLGADILVIVAVILLGRHQMMQPNLTFYRFTDSGVVPIDTGIDIAFVIVLFILGYFFLSGQYSHRRPFWDELRFLTQGLFIGFLVDLLILIMSGIPDSVAVATITWGSLMILLPLTRISAKRLLIRSGLWQIPTVILGCGENARQTAMALSEEHLLGFEIQSFISTRATDVAKLRIGDRDIPVQVCTPDSLKVLRQGDKPHVIMALEEDELNQHSGLMNIIAQRHNAVDVVPPVRGLPLYGLEVNHLLARELLLLRTRNNLARRAPRLLKRVLDLSAAILLTILLSPVLGVIAYLIGRSGPVIYGHHRIGQNGKPFKCLKFRTMVPNADAVLKELLETDRDARAEWERDYKLKNDPRITRIGGYLRRTSLDELPQLLNVLRGEMSLIGPRPIVEDELSRYGNFVDYYLQVKPGISGLWQISGRNDVDYTQRVFLDSWYVKNWSLWYDIMILLRTVLVVVRKQGAY